MGFLRVCAHPSIRRRAVQPDVLAAAIGAHMRSFQKLYGDVVPTPKFHFAQHLPQALQRFGFLSLSSRALCVAKQVAGSDKSE